VAQAEINGGSVGCTFMKLVDNGQGHFIALTFNYSSSQFQLYSDLSNVIASPVITLLDQYYGFGINALPTDDGRIEIQLIFNNQYCGSFYTPTTWNFDQFELGAIDNPGSEPIDHYYRNVGIGTVTNGNDVFNTNSFAAHTVEPPFDSISGTFFEVTLNGQLHVSNSGIHASVIKALQAVIQPPPPPTPDPWINDPGDSTIIVAGNSRWNQAGQSSWIIDNWGLDKLIIPMRGSRRTRDAFLATLTPWMPFPGDGNMFLTDITQQQHDASNFPKIDLVFTGKKGGVLPQDKESTGEQVQQISGRSIYNTTHTLSIWFVSTTSEKVTYSRNPIDLSSVTPAEPAQIQLIWLTETDVVWWAGTFATYYAAIEAAIPIHFVSTLATTGTSETLIPGQYYRASRTTQRLYFPVLG
jgi:hypothetical protein